MGKTDLVAPGDEIYYVYSHVDPRDDEVIYVGHGCRGRAWIHGSKRTCLRDQDHLSHLEDLTLNGFLASDWVEVLVSGISKSKACKVEQEFIRDLRPRYNKQMGLSTLKVTEAMFSTMVELREDGMSYKEIGEIIGVSIMTAYRALNNKTKNIGKWS